MKLLREGKAKRLYETGDPSRRWMGFTGDVTTVDGRETTSFEGKSGRNKALTLLLFEIHHREHRTANRVAGRDETALPVPPTESIPLEVVVSNIACGHLCRRTPLTEGTKRKPPVVEFFAEDDVLGDPGISGEPRCAWALSPSGEVASMKTEALRINELLKTFFLKNGMILADVRLAFGRLRAHPSPLVLADEITPDPCRRWDVESGRVLDKDRIPRDLNDVMESYAEVLKRVEDAAHS